MLLALIVWLEKTKKVLSENQLNRDLDAVVILVDQHKFSKMSLRIGLTT